MNDIIKQYTTNNVVNWIKISTHQSLSEDFIREFKDYVNWSGITFKQKLSEDFMQEFSNCIDWKYLSKTKLSEEFIKIM